MEFSQGSPLNADEVITREEAEPFPRMEDTWPAAILVALFDQERETERQEVSGESPGGAEQDLQPPSPGWLEGTTGTLGSGSGPTGNVSLGKL